MVSILRVAGLVVLAGTTIVDAADSSDSFKPEPNVPGPFRALEYFGCFKDATPMKDEGMYKFMTSGLCQKVCYQAKSAVMGMTDGYSCWCGANLPAEDTAVANDTCSTSCPGYPQEKCGGDGRWSVYSTGYSLNKVVHYEPKSSSSSSSSPTSSPTSSSSPSSSDSPSPSPEKKEGSNTLGIAIGTVVGVVVVAAALGGLFFFMRSKKKEDPVNDGNPFGDPYQHKTLVYGPAGKYNVNRDSQGSIRDMDRPGGPLVVTNPGDDRL